MKHKNLYRLAVALMLAGGLVSVVATQGAAQFGGRIFGLGNYPGGSLYTVFEMQNGPNAPIRTYTIEVVPVGDHFSMTETIHSPVLYTGDVQSGLGRSGAAGTAGARYDEDQQNPNIDLTPLNTLEDREVIVEPNQNSYLPDGARLITGDVETIAGIEVVMGTYLHPSYPSQRVIMGFADPEVEALLLFPVYMMREVDGEQDYLVRLVEFRHEL